MEGVGVVGGEGVLRQDAEELLGVGGGDQLVVGVVGVG